MLAIALALGSSACWGTADFLGGLKSRALPVVVVLCVMYCAGLVVMIGAVLLFAGAFPSATAVSASVLAGLAGIAALGCFYKALSIGTMSIVAPIAATGVVLPVVVGLARGDEPGLLAAVGLPVAVVGVVLASRESDAALGDPVATRRAAGLAVIAGLGFGGYLVGADIASEESVPWALFVTRAVAAPVLVAVVLARRERVPRSPVTLVQLALIGTLDLAANALYNTATTKGDLSAVSVAGSLYPVVTVLLAAALLGERVRGTQRVGVVAALGGVLMIAAG